MKIFFIAAASFLILSFSSGEVLAQSRKTIILVRHAEKDALQEETSDDPDLSVAGRERAVRLAKIAQKYRFGAVFSSDTKRTRQTAEPTADHRHLTVQIYDPRKQNDLVKQVLSSKTKRFLIVGHSNTIPMLVNLLIKKDLFQSLGEGEYGSIWIIRIRRGEIKKVEVLSY